MLLNTVAACSQADQHQGAAVELHAAQIDNTAIMEAYKNKQSDVWVEGSAEVIKLLKDDTYGSQHQRFLVKLSARDKQTLLFAHNIDLAPRINSLKVGDTITFKGEYEYNPKGGIVHWTHHDPDGSQPGGWIKHQGKVYE
jgi:uncharacterized protein YjdB